MPKMMQYMGTALPSLNTGTVNNDERPGDVMAGNRISNNLRDVSLFGDAQGDSFLKAVDWGGSSGVSCAINEDLVVTKKSIAAQRFCAARAEDGGSFSGIVLSGPPVSGDYGSSSTSGVNSHLGFDSHLGWARCGRFEVGFCT
uniref:Uncharacterized protein n=1 Tax=Nelumbo nucifera TaxID=4432 RepID=A0A822ZPG3_NELNU|nr:TPA_asm: hypothetical protein HUJ06_017801 [Nelumbo nucifera]